MRKVIFFAFLSILFSCTEDHDWTGAEKTGLPIKLSAEYPVVTQTRATDNGFSNGDQVGVFVMDYENGNPGTMALGGNRASNVLLTYSEADREWSAPMTLYWSVDGTPADIIGYYPFMESLESVTAQPVTVARDQSSSATALAKGGYEQSDLLWAKSPKVSPTKETVTLKFQHVMAGLNIRLECGTGFTAEEWAALKKTVMVGNTLLNGTFDLTTGKVTTVSGSQEGPVTATAYGDAWRAVVIPQTVAAGKPVVTITVDGQNYSLTRTESLSYVAGKMHNFTITVNRRTPSGNFEFKLTNEAVVAWEVDANIHDGLTRAYVVVNVNTPGTLQKAIAEKNLDYEDISNLKVIGNINRTDLELMGQKMLSLTNLNLQEAVIDDGVLTGFKDHNVLNSIIFPESGLKAFADSAFYNAGLAGSLTIPEGVTSIGESAFEKCKYTGSLSLPSTLKMIHMGAFARCQFTGELLLPEEVDFDSRMLNYLVNTPVFLDCKFSGSIHLPKSLRHLPHLGFEGMTGDIIIPQGVTELVSPPQNVTYNWGVFSDGGYDGTVTIPEGVRMIGSRTFAGTKIHGEVKLPSTLKYMEFGVFEGTRISKIIFNDELITMDRNCFRDCIYLSGTVTWPRKCTRIPEGTFQNCTLLSGVVLHKDVTTIGDEAFLRCSNLTSIVCEGEEPPLIGTDAFLGVSKSNAVVVVPPTAVEKYRQANGWSDFQRIVASNDFDCQPQTACALNKTHQETIVLYADGAWTVEHKPDWCTLSKTSGKGKTEILLTFNALPHGAGNREDNIVFRQTAEGYTTSCKLSQYDYQYEEDGCLTLQSHKKGKGIDIVFAGDGWDAASIADGSYLDLVKYQSECFFSIEPYRSMRDYFDVNVTFPLSQQIGVNTMYTYVNNKFGTLHGESSINGCCTSSLLITEADKVMEYVAEKAPLSGTLSHGLVILVPNSTDYSGNTILGNDGTALSICPPSENVYPRDTRGTIQHEAGGHGFGKLGDETITMNAFPKEDVRWKLQEMFWRGWYQNLSLSGKLNEVPWADFIFDTRYSDYVDVYEGGYGYTRGVYRPEANSCMNYGVPYYNTPSRLAIWKRIKEYAGEGYTMDEFYAQDTSEWGPLTVTRSQAVPQNGQGYAESNQHVPSRIVDFHKSGMEVRKIREQLRIKNK